MTTLKLTTSSVEVMDDKEKVKRLSDNLNRSWKHIDKLEAEKKKLIMNFRTRKLLIGGHSTGKTMFVRSSILGCIDYFLIDINNEYMDVVPYKKCVSQNKKEILTAIRSNLHKILVIEDTRSIHEDYGWLFKEIEHSNYIIITQSIIHIEEYLDKFDTIYDFGVKEIGAEEILKKNRDKVMDMKYYSNK